ncbi:hypothetical protein ABPG74_016082 [Tetrahymena malaccensis]
MDFQVVLEFQKMIRKSIKTVRIVKNDINLTIANISRDADLNEKGVSTSTINWEAIKYDKSQKQKIYKFYRSIAKKELEKIFYTSKSNFCVNKMGCNLLGSMMVKAEDRRLKKIQQKRPLSIKIQIIIGIDGVEDLYSINDITYSSSHNIFSIYVQELYIMNQPN